MRKKLMCIILASIFCLCGLGMLGGCSGGTLYNLDEAYEAGLITYDDLLNIAYHNGDIERNQEALEGFEPKPIGKLSEWKSLQIRKAVAESYKYGSYDPSVDYISIEYYLGCYHGYYAFRAINKDSISIWSGKTPCQTVAGIEFWYGETNKIKLWKKG